MWWHTTKTLHFICQILHPQKWYKLRRRWQRLLLSSVWLLGAIIALPVVFSLIDVKTAEEQYDGRSCKNQRIAPALEAVYILFIVCCHIGLLSLYMLVVKGVKKTEIPDKKQSSVRINQLFIRIIAASLVVNVLPLILRVLYVIALFTKSQTLLLFSKKLTFVECFYFFTHCLNPFLYFFASQPEKRENNSKKKIYFMSLSWYFILTPVLQFHILYNSINWIFSNLGILIRQKTKQNCFLPFYSQNNELRT